MGELALSRKDLGVKRLEREAGKTEEECGVVTQGEESSGLVIMWEKLLKRRMLRVLLVEADDSTRQVIAALLRKCSYKVAAVSDGLKAWEVLKGRPHNIDLILTEVDLPAISGFALLTLIMEHEICKNIPVIMMSSHDSISTVYKCMLRGAADYLVKPIRKNELSNLWQHVWRKQTSMVLNGPQDESVVQQKFEGTCENNTASNHSSGDLACIQRNKELIEKGSDAQSSCTKPDLEAKSTPIEDLEEHTQSKCNKAYLSVKKVQENEPRIDLVCNGIRHDGHTIGLALGISKNGDTAATLGRDSDSVYHKAKTGNLSEASDNSNALVSSSREATDFTFHIYPTNDLKISTSISEKRKITPSSQLELSLRRSESHSFDNEVIEEKNTLVHSDASAFKRYNSRQLQTSPGKHQIGCGTESEKNTSYMFTGYNSEISAPSLQRSFSPGTVHSKESEIATLQLQQQPFPIAVPVKGIRYKDVSKTCGSVLPPVFYAQSGGPLPMPSSVSVAHRESSAADIFHQSNIGDHNSPKLYKPLGENATNGNELTKHRQDHGVDTFENRGGHISSATDQSASSGFCNGAISHLNSVAYGSNYGNDSTADQSPAVISYESKTEDWMKYGFANRSVQREAALTKFRLKRKERCYEKKVRYESRKKLAEQRPRVKGQFVRQVQPDLHPTTEKNW